MSSAPNIFLNGPHTPYASEHRIDDLPVVGALPLDLEGSWYTMSSNPQFEPASTERYHWFDGDGMIFALTIGGGRASAATRWVEAAGLLAERRAGRALYGPMINGGFPVPPPPEGPVVKNPANTTAMMFGGRLLIFSELDLPHELDSVTLDTLGQFNFGGVEGPVTAHGKVDPDNGDLLFYGAQGVQLVWYRADAAGRLLEHHAFPVDHAYSVHDFAVTDDYAIFFTSPTVIDIEGLMKGGPAFVWEDDVPATIWLLDRRTKQVSSIVMPDRFAVTHFLNAWQDGGTIVVHGNRTTQWGVARGDLEKPLKPEYFFPAFPWEWRIDPASGKVTDRQISTINSEFARHDPRRETKPVRFGYYAATMDGQFGKNALFDRIVKIDITNGEATFAKPERLTAPSETIFVPRPGGTAEDDGWALTLWWNEATDRTEVTIHDAANFSATPLARMPLPFRLPPGFHGNWHPKGQI